MTRDPNDRPDRELPSGEEALIAAFWAPLAAACPGAYGLKDDCATIAVPPGQELVVTTDALIAGVHFIPEDDPTSVAWKALAVNVSDLVAKGATPLAYVMNVGLPSLDRAWLEAFSGGLRVAQQAFGCQLVGGDTDRTPGPLSISITAFGTVPSGRMIRRSTAQPGDYVYVTGTIGDAALGLALLQDPQTGTRCGLDEAASTYLAGRLSRPVPPLALAPVVRACASAAMDISDGLMKDFDRLCRASGVAGRIEAGRVPLSEAARAILACGGASLTDLMSGGEDYEVLATIAPERAPELERLAAAAGTRTTRIGDITRGSPGAVAVSASGEAITFVKSGWDHFSQP